MFFSNHEPILYCFRDKWQFLSKITSFSHPVYLTPRLGSSPWNFVTAVALKKPGVMPIPDGLKSLTIHVCALFKIYF